MQSKTTRGLRRLLVSTGVISLVLSVAAPAALADKPDDRKVWVCHGTGSLENPFELNHVDAGAPGHEHDRVVVLPEDSDVTNKADLNRMTEEELDALIEATCEALDDEAAPDETLPEEGEVVVVIPPGTDDGIPPGHGGAIPGTGDQTPPHQDDGPIVVIPPTGGIDVPPGDGGVVPGTGDQTPPESDDEPLVVPSPEGAPAEKPAPVISTVTVTRPAPAAPVVAPAAPVVAPAAPAQPAAPQAPAVPAQPAVTQAPAAPAPSVAAVVTSSRTEVLGSVTTRTPTGAKVTALAATGTSTTVVLAALGAVLLLAGLGLQVTARRVQSSAVGA